MALKSKSLDKVRTTVPVTETAPVEEIVRININVPASTRARWKSYAALQGRPMTDIIIEAINTHLSK